MNEQIRIMKPHLYKKLKKYSHHQLCCISVYLEEKNMCYSLESDTIELHWGLIYSSSLASRGNTTDCCLMPSCSSVEDEKGRVALRRPRRLQRRCRRAEAALLKRSLLAPNFLRASEFSPRALMNLICYLPISHVRQKRCKILRDRTAWQFTLMGQTANFVNPHFGGT